MKLSLRAYNRLIEELVESGDTQEAILHCHHILLDFPRHLETYRLLGKAFTEQNDYINARAKFEHVLSISPDDFVSNVGNSIIFDEMGKIEKSTWHMERAFEVQPSNLAIQSELQRLYGLRDGIAPSKIRMTRGALARMYVQAELFPNAIKEINTILFQEPQRFDMLVLLANVYFKNSQKREAANLCKRLLISAPYCFDANRIMYELTRPNHFGNEAKKYLQRVINLDPYAEYSENNLFKSYEVPDDAISLEIWQQSPEVFSDKIEPNSVTIANYHNTESENQDEVLNLKGSLRVFLCHSSNDKPAVRELYNLLKFEEKIKIDPWLDEEKLDPGDEWDLEIRKAVRETHLVIVCLSKNSTTKEGYVQKEIRDALDVAQEKPPGTVYIIPLRLEDCDVPERLRRYHWLNFYEEKAYERLVNSLRKRAKDFGIS